MRERSPRSAGPDFGTSVIFETRGRTPAPKSFPVRPRVPYAPRMQARAIRFGALLVLLFGCLLVPLTSSAQTTVKAIEGKVLDSGTGPLPGSIVYLQDTKTNVIKTFIATADGTYRFGQLPSDTDYQVWAEYKGKKSKVRLVSSFDTKLTVTQNFHISDK